MIYLETFNSIIESIYLQENITNKIGLCNIFVNPGQIKYITRKNVIINIPDYPRESIEKLLENECNVITRLDYDLPGTIFQPYILRVNFNVMWNGKTLDELYQDSQMFEKNFIDFNPGEKTLYFPKINLEKSDPRIIYKENLTGLGWALQQVGLNILPETPFKDLDLVKSKKLEL